MISTVCTLEVPCHWVGLAAGCDHPDCLRELHERGEPWDERAPCAAALYNNLVCLRYLHERGCDWDRRVWHYWQIAESLPTPATLRSCDEYLLDNDAPLPQDELLRKALLATPAGQRQLRRHRDRKQVDHLLRTTKGNVKHAILLVRKSETDVDECEVLSILLEMDSHYNRDDCSVDSPACKCSVQPSLKASTGSQTETEVLTDEQDQKCPADSSCPTPTGSSKGDMDTVTEMFKKLGLLNF
jgi:hypothetical protein